MWKTVLCLTSLLVLSNVQKSTADNGVGIQKTNSSKSSEQANLRTLQLVQVIMRHGERNPVEGHPLSPYTEEDWVGGYGYLTPTGEKQTCELGQYLRKRYDGFLDSFYEQHEIFAISSDMDRSIRSGISTLRGLYPRVGSEPERSNDSQVVPIRTLPAQQDNIIVMSQKCAQYDTEFTNYLLTSRENQKWEAEGKAILQLLTNNTEVLTKTVEDNKFLFDNIQIQRFQNKQQPKWVTPQVEEFSDRYILYRIQVETRTEKMRKFRSVIIQTMIENMEKCVEDIREKKNTKGKKLILYSGHDRTLMTILNILNTSNHFRPSFASAVLVELHKDINNQDYRVEIYYRNVTTEEPHKLDIKGCQNNADEPCFLRNFKALMEPLNPKDYRQECELSVGTSSKNLGQTLARLVVSFILSFTLLVLPVTT